jgi:hypothetical protein
MQKERREHKNKTLLKTYIIYTIFNELNNKLQINEKSLWVLGFF